MASHSASARRIVRFGIFELDAFTDELRKSGSRLNVQDQPLQVLKVLLERPGELVTREELRQRMWPSDTFVDFDHGLNAAVGRLRETLGDSADAPRFIETLPRRGYRFIGSVTGDGSTSPVTGLSEPQPDSPEQTSSAPQPVKVVEKRRRVALWAALIAAGLGVPLACWGAFSLGKRAGVSPTPTFHQLTFRRGGVVSARFTPDGKTVVYGAAWDGSPVRMFSTRVEGPESSALPQPDADIAGISSSAEMLIILNRPFMVDVGESTLARVPLAGGTARRIAERVSAADWSPDGRLIAVTREVGERSRVEYPLGTAIHDGFGAWGARVSRDGARVAFYAMEKAGSAKSVAVSDRSGQTRVLSTGWKWTAKYLAWSPSGDEIWFAATRGGWTAPLRAVSMSGQERIVLNLPGWLNVQDVSSDGRALLTYARGRRSEIRCRLAGESGERDLSWFESSQVTYVSPDGKTILFAEVGNASPTTAGFLRRTDGSPPERLGEVVPMSLSPDGKWILCADQKDNHLVALPTGPGQPRPLTRPGLDWQAAGWFPDSTRVLVTWREAAGSPRTYAVDLARGTAQLLTPEGLICSGLSPDGKNAMCLSETGEGVTYSFEQKQTYPGPDFKLADGEEGIASSDDGRFLFVRSGDAPDPIRIFRLDLVSGKRELWREIVPPDPAGLLRSTVVVISPDGESYCYSPQHAFSDLYLVEGLQ